MDEDVKLMSNLLFTAHFPASPTMWAPVAVAMIPTPQQPSHEIAFCFPTYWTQMAMVMAEQTLPHHRRWRANARQEKRQKIKQCARRGAKRQNRQRVLAHVAPGSGRVHPSQWHPRSRREIFGRCVAPFPTPNTTCWVIWVQFYF